MQFSSAAALRYVRNAALTAAGFVITSALAGLIVALCEDAGLLEHPLDRAGVALALLRAVLTDLRTAWIAGGILGFAIGVWLDHILRAWAERETRRVVVARKPEKGFLDYRMDVEKASRQMIGIMSRIGQHTVWIGNRIAKQTKKFERIASLGDRGEKSIRSALTIANTTASYCKKYCVRISTLEQQFQTAALDFTVSINWLIDHKQASYSISDISELKASLKSSKENVDEFINAIISVQGLAADLNNVIAQMRTLLISMMGTLDYLEGFCGDILDKLKN
jgi:hypothetical protein